jgi:hypothetical protein
MTIVGFEPTQLALVELELSWTSRRCVGTMGGSKQQSCKLGVIGDVHTRNPTWVVAATTRVNPAEKPTEKPTDKHAEKQAEKPTEKPTEGLRV